jgi:hypothetical protein
MCLTLQNSNGDRRGIIFRKSAGILGQGDARASNLSQPSIAAQLPNEFDNLR